MLVDVLGTTAIVGSGLVAGVFFAVAVSVIPTVLALPTDQYVEIHRSLGRGYHPVMPLVVTVALVADVGLVLLAPSAVTRILFVLAVLATVGVQVVSQFGNVPINKRVEVLDSRAIPADWQDPRMLWRSWHFLRTAFAVIALAVNGLAISLL